MDIAVVTTWITLGVIITLSVIGWALAYYKYSTNEARHMGEIKGTVEGLDKRMESIDGRMASLETNLSNRMTGLEKRIDGFLDNG